MWHVGKLYVDWEYRNIHKYLIIGKSYLWVYLCVCVVTPVIGHIPWRSLGSYVCEVVIQGIGFWGAWGKQGQILYLLSVYLFSLHLSPVLHGWSQDSYPPKRNSRCCLVGNLWPPICFSKTLVPSVAYGINGIFYICLSLRVIPWWALYSSDLQLFKAIYK